MYVMKLERVNSDLKACLKELIQILKPALNLLVESFTNQRQRIFLRKIRSPRFVCELSSLSLHSRAYFRMIQFTTGRGFWYILKKETND